MTAISSTTFSVPSAVVTSSPPSARLLSNQDVPQGRQAYRPRSAGRSSASGRAPPFVLPGVSKRVVFHRRALARAATRGGSAGGGTRPVGSTQGRPPQALPLTARARREGPARHGALVQPPPRTRPCVEYNVSFI